MSIQWYMELVQSWNIPLSYHGRWEPSSREVMVLVGSRVSYPSQGKLLQLLKYPALELGRNGRGQKFVQLLYFAQLCPPMGSSPSFCSNVVLHSQLS